MEEMTNRIIPYNAEAEKSVIGSILMDRECLATVIEYVRAGDFYDPRNAELFEALMDLFNMDSPIDIITVAEQLRHKGTFESVGGETYLADVASSVSTSANVKHYAKIVSEYSIRRKLISVSNEISGMAYEGNEQIDKLLDISEQRIFDVSENKNMSYL